LVLRLYAGKILYKISPLTLLAISSVLAIFGLYTLSIATGWFIFLAATLYGLGKTFFWPTTLGVVADQTPKGGALTLNAVSGIGMLTVGMLGAPIIGVFQSNSQINELQVSQELAQIAPPTLVNNDIINLPLKNKTIYSIINYEEIDAARLNQAIDGASNKKLLNGLIEKLKANGTQKALSTIIIFPVIMLICFLFLIFYFQSKGGYKPIELSENAEN
ncbi:MAG: hypothetical protein P8K14_01160, partial [Flavobacteriaceae bacterium]|nr:hypothetical protein [Flavobacteriaceae bacterium]